MMATDPYVLFAWEQARRVNADMCRVEQGKEGLIAAALISFVEPVERDRLHLQAALAAIIRERMGAKHGNRDGDCMRAMAEIAREALGDCGPWGTRELDIVAGNALGASVEDPGVDSSGGQ